MSAPRCCLGCCNLQREQLGPILRDVVKQQGRGILTGKRARIARLQ